MPKFTHETATAIIAVVGLIGGFILITLGHDGYIAASMTLIIGYYFGNRNNPNKPAAP